MEMLALIMLHKPPATQKVRKLRVPVPALRSKSGGGSKGGSSAGGSSKNGTANLKKRPLFDGEVNGHHGDPCFASTSLGGTFPPLSEFTAWVA